MAFEQIIAGLKHFNANKWNFVREAIDQNAEEIASINTTRIYEKGTDDEGKKLNNKNTNYKDYSPSYKRKKEKLGVYKGYVNLSLSGEYLRAYRVTESNDEVEIAIDQSNADLDAYLRELYGEGIRGLSQKEWDLVAATFILPKIMNEISKIFK